MGRARQVLVLGLALGTANGQSVATPTADTDAGLRYSFSPLPLLDGGPSPFPFRVEEETAGQAELRRAVEAECDLLEPPVCHQRALALMQGDGGPTEVKRAVAFAHAACRRGFAPSCAPFTRPDAIDPARPQYTEAARKHGVEGTVLVKCTLPVDGRPRDCLIIKSLPYLDEAVLSALASSRYAPVKFLGYPYQITYVFNFSFRLR